SGTDDADTSIDLTGSGLPGTYKVFRSSGTEQTVSLGTITGGSHISMTIPAGSIVTITNVPEITPVTPGTALPATLKPVSDANFTSGKNFFIAAQRGFIESLTLQINGGA